MQKLFKISFFLLLFFLLSPSFAFADQELKPTLIWKRSTEAQNAIVSVDTLGSGVNTAVNLPLDSGQTVFDNGIFTPQENKNNVPVGNKWASWPQYSKVGATCGPKFELRHFQAKFSLPSGLTVKKVILSSPYHTDPVFAEVFPINDNAYIFLNGTQTAQLGTSYSPIINRGFHGIAPIANEVDGWIANGDLGQNPANLLQAGENTLDIVTEERCLWGGLGYLELKLKVEGTILNVPYFNQTTPPWGPQEYDHANTIGPFFCGRTIAQCGCALTSAAMLLKYYGVEKSPNNLPTDPDTLNNWLKDPKNKGYIYGNVDWFAIARYSKKAHDVFGTSIVDYVLPIFGEDFVKLNEELQNERPVILKVPGHFIVATDILGQTYSINDPRWKDKTTLQAYNGHFQEMRRFIKTNSNLSGILIATQTPAEFLVIDEQGRRMGRDPNTGQLFNEIPNATYHLETPLVDDTFENTPIPPESNGTFLFEAADPALGKYQIITSSDVNRDITFRGYDQDGEISEQVFQQQVGSQEYQLNYSPELGSQIQVIRIVDIDIKPDSNPNPINLNNKGVIPVAILTTSGFDATQVDAPTVKFGPNQAKELHNKGHLEDVDNDGDIDLILHFRTQETGIKNTDMEVCLIGNTFSGNQIQGCDPIQIIPK